MDHEQKTNAIRLWIRERWHGQSLNAIQERVLLKDSDYVGRRFFGENETVDWRVDLDELFVRSNDSDTTEQWNAVDLYRDSGDALELMHPSDQNATISMASTIQDRQDSNDETNPSISDAA